MNADKILNGKKSAQAVKEAFQVVRDGLPTTWLKQILRTYPDLNREPHLTRLKNIRIGRVAPNPDEIQLFESVEPSGTPIHGQSRKR